jgi:hypothetical protein
LNLDYNRTVPEILRQVDRVAMRFPQNDLLWTTEEFEQKVATGEIQVFPVGKRSVMVSKTFEDVVQLIAAAGDMHELLSNLDEFEAWHKERGATEIRIVGRVGWERVLHDRGYKKTLTSALVKEL